MKAALGRVEEVNKELWVLLSLFAICLLLNLRRRRAADGPQLLHAPDPRVGLLLRPPARDADRAGQRPARHPDDLVQPGALRRGERGRRASRPRAGSTSPSGAAC